ncbi:hypothetical protein GUITHDRAFT_53615, partial [Guillardia theta CCMP2712]
RTSTSCRVPRSHPVAAAAVMRAAFLCGVSPHCSEAVQVVHYERGQRYDVHNDWFQPGTPYYHDRVWQRIISFFCYLSEVPEGQGGCTFFPELDLRFRPSKGSAALWYNQV